MRHGFATLAVGSLGALLLPGALALVACLLWVHLHRYRAVHARLFAGWRRPGRLPFPPALAAR